jgi:hypothetical protein
MTRRGTTLAPDAWSRPSRNLLVHVLGTTTEGTGCALADAKRLTDGLDAEVILLVPRLTRVGPPFDPSADERRTIIDEHRALAAKAGLHVRLLFCVCQRYDDVVHQMLGRSSILIVGGRRRWWWPTREERLVARLSAEGYPVVFAQVGAHPGAGSAPEPAF